MERRIQKVVSLRPRLGEAVYTRYNAGARAHEVVGTESGYCYAQYTFEMNASAAVREMNEERDGRATESVSNSNQLISKS